MVTLRALCALAVLTVGCAGRSHGTTTPTSSMKSGNLEAAALPYQVLDGRTGRQLEEPAFWDRLGKAQAVCVGEDHPNPHHHWVQLEVVRRLVKQLPPGGKLALGLEMVQRPFQGVLDDYEAKRIDAAALRSRVGWEERWGYDWGFYGPTIDAALAGGAHLLALNAPKELTKKIARKGLASLTPDERAQVPELNLEDKAHRAWFDALMESFGGTHAHSKASSSEAPEDGQAEPHQDHPPTDVPTADNTYTVQVVWDETMADTTAAWLAANPGGHAIILAGNGHCHDTAIVARLKRRGIADAVSIHPVLDTEGNVAEALAKPMNDYVIVLQLPGGPSPDKSE